MSLCEQNVCGIFPFALTHLEAHCVHLCIHIVHSLALAHNVLHTFFFITALLLSALLERLLAAGCWSRGLFRASDGYVIFV
jgi:hypothetical protein